MNFLSIEHSEQELHQGQLVNHVSRMIEGSKFGGHYVAPDPHSVVHASHVYGLDVLLGTHISESELLDLLGFKPSLFVQHERVSNGGYNQEPPAVSCERLAADVAHQPTGNESSIKHLVEEHKPPHCRSDFDIARLIFFLDLVDGKFGF